MDIEYIVKTVEDIALPIVEENKCELVDVEFVEEEGDWFLRVYIDKEDGININDCEAVSRPLSDKIDEADPIDIGYYLEVSSPGINRALKKDRDFERYKDRKIEIAFLESYNYNGKDIIEGVLLGLAENKIVLNCKGRVIEVDRANVKNVNLKEI